MFKGLMKKFSGESLPSFDADHILEDTVSTTRDEALQFVATAMTKAGYVRSGEFVTDLIARDDKSSTGFKEHIATPHAKSKQVLHAGIWVVRLTHDIAWETMDEKPVRTLVAFAIPTKGKEDVMLPLIAISRANMKEAFRNTLNNGDKASIAAAIKEAIGGTL